MNPHHPHGQPFPNLPNDPLTNIGQTQIIYAVYQCPGEHHYGNAGKSTTLFCRIRIGSDDWPRAAAPAAPLTSSGANRRRTRIESERTPAQPSSPFGIKCESCQCQCGTGRHEQGNGEFLGNAMCLLHAQYVEPVRDSRTAAHTSPLARETVTRSATRTYLPPRSNSPPLYTEDPPDEDEYWQAVPDITFDSSVCELLDNMSLSGGNSPRGTPSTPRAAEKSQPLSQQAREQPSGSISTHVRELPRSVSFREHHQEPFPSSSHTRGPLLRPAAESLSPQYQPTSSTRLHAAPQLVISPEPSSSVEEDKRKYYVVSRGRDVGVFDDW